MTITASLVKELREKSGAGMMDCKKALNETNGDLEAAIDFLRTKGLASAAKKAGRTAAEGLVAIASNTNKVALIELNSETDFVARNDEFQALATNIANTTLSTNGNVEEVRAAQLNNKSVSENITDLIGTIGENMTLRRTSLIQEDAGVVATYIHNKTTDNSGQIGVAVALKSDGDKSAIETIGKQIAMHIAAAKPVALTRDGVDSEIIEKEKQIFIEQAREQGKPDNIIEKMVEGRIRKYYGEIVLTEQVFVIDGKATITEWLAEQAKQLGTEIEITDYAMLILGEGIEKEEEDFAAEVAKVANG